MHEKFLYLINIFKNNNANVPVKCVFHICIHQVYTHTRDMLWFLSYSNIQKYADTSVLAAVLVVTSLSVILGFKD